MWIWDRAGIDLRQWYQWKQGSGIYFISRAKENMLIHEGNAPMIFDPADPVNAGVERDDLWAGSTTGVSMRVVHYIDPVTNESFQFITSLTDSKKHPPGVIAMLYHMRWDIEKVFDDVKNKLHETKAWASSETAKSNQATLICLTRNLMRIFERQLEVKHGIRNEAEQKRKTKRLTDAKETAGMQGRCLPELYVSLQRVTQIPAKFIRWIRYSVFGNTSETQALRSLRQVYAKL